MRRITRLRSIHDVSAYSSSNISTARQRRRERSGCSFAFTTMGPIISAPSASASLGATPTISCTSAGRRFRCAFAQSWGSFLSWRARTSSGTRCGGYPGSRSACNGFSTIAKIWPSTSRTAKGMTHEVPADGSWPFPHASASKRSCAICSMRMSSYRRLAFVRCRAITGTTLMFARRAARTTAWHTCQAIPIPPCLAATPTGVGRSGCPSTV